MSRTPLEARVAQRLHELADHTPIAGAGAPAAEAPAAGAPAGLAGSVGSVVPLGRHPTRPRRRRTVAALVAAAALLVVVGAGAALVRRETTLATAPAAPGADATHVVLPGWRTAGYQDLTTPASDDVRLLAVARDQNQGLAGPEVRVGVAVPPSGYSAGDDARPVDVGGTTASLAMTGDRSTVVWPAPGGGDVFVVTSRLAEAEALAVARGLRLAPDRRSAELTSLPAGLIATALVPPTAGQPERYVEYGFERDGVGLQLSFYEGGRAAFELRTMDDTRRAVTVGGRPGVLLDYGDGRYRVDLFDGVRTWEADGSPFPSAEAFLAAVGQIRAVDDATWQASVADATSSGKAGSAAATPSAATVATIPAPRRWRRRGERVRPGWPGQTPSSRGLEDHDPHGGTPGRERGGGAGQLGEVAAVDGEACSTTSPRPPVTDRVVPSGDKPGVDRASPLVKAVVPSSVSEPSRLDRDRERLLEPVLTDEQVPAVVADLDPARRRLAVRERASPAIGLSTPRRLTSNADTVPLPAPAWALLT